MIWNPEYECMDRAALHALQLRRLQMTTSWAYERIPYWRAQLEERGVRPRDIKSLDDVRRLPFTDERALGEVSPFGGFALPLEEVVRVHSSTSESGEPVVLGYSRGDINTWTELTARVAAAAGVHRGDLVLMAFPYGMSTSGWGMHYGMERLGATIIPAGAEQSDRHVADDAAPSARRSWCPRRPTPCSSRSRPRSSAWTPRRSSCGSASSAASRAPTP